MSFFKKTSKDDGSEQLLKDVMKKVLPHLHKSVEAHVENEKQKVICSVVEQMQNRLADVGLTPSQSYRAPVAQVQQVQAVPDPIALLSPGITPAATDQAAMLAHVLNHMAPYIDASVKKIVDKEKDNLIGNVVGNIQQTIEQKTSS
jgi:hypothetical protein